MSVVSISLIGGLHIRQEAALVKREERGGHSRYAEHDASAAGIYGGILLVCDAQAERGQLNPQEAKPYRNFREFWRLTWWIKSLGVAKTNLC